VNKLHVYYFTYFKVTVTVGFVALVTMLRRLLAVQDFTYVPVAVREGWLKYIK
jgi:hypothetical protein